MSGRRQSIKVEVLGDEYSLRSDATAEHTLAVASHVDATVRQLMRGGAVVDAHKMAIMAALQIADELFRTRAALGDAAAGIQQLGEEVRRWLPPDKRAAQESG